MLFFLYCLFIAMSIIFNLGLHINFTFLSVYSIILGLLLIYLTLYRVHSKFLLSFMHVVPLGPYKWNWQLFTNLLLLVSFSLHVGMPYIILPKKYDISTQNSEFLLFFIWRYHALFLNKGLNAFEVSLLFQACDSLGLHKWNWQLFTNLLLFVSLCRYVIHCLTHKTWYIHTKLGIGRYHALFLSKGLNI